MADETKTLNKINVGNTEFDLTPWGQTQMSKLYFLALLSRDEFTPVAEKQPLESDTLYIDPACGRQAAFHSGQCVIYPDSEIKGGYGLSIAAHITYGEDNVIPVSIQWFHLTDLFKEMSRLDSKIKAIEQASGINTDWILIDGTWDGDKHWYGSALWNGGEE